MKEQIYKIVKALSNQCDGAVNRDNVGFNASHTHLGKRLANLPLEDWTEEHFAYCANHLLPTYKNQIEAMGFELPTYKQGTYTQQSEINALSQESEKKNLRKTTHVLLWKEQHNQWFLKFPYNAEMLKDIRLITPKGEFNRHFEKEWAFSRAASEDIQTFCKKWDIFVTPEDDVRLDVFIETTAKLPKEEEKNPYRIEEKDGTFHVFFPYSEHLVSEIKRIFGASFRNIGEKYWAVTPTPRSLNDLYNFCLHAHPAYRDYAGQVQNALKEITVEKAKMEAFSKAVNAEVDLDTSRLRLELRPFQRVGVRFLIDNGSVLNSDDLGIGKTCEALATVVCGPNRLPVLVVTPASLKLNWAKEAISWIKNVSVTILDSKAKEFTVTTKQGERHTVFCNDFSAEIVIVNYDILDRFYDQIAITPFKAMVIDESHNIKNYKAKRTKTVLSIAKNIRYKYALSGTPILNRASELLPQLDYLGRLPAVGGKTNFLRRYCVPSNSGWGTTYDGSQNLDELHKILRQEGVYIRRTKKQVLTELPDKERVTVPLGFDAAFQAEYNKAEADFIEFLRKDGLLKKDFLESIKHLTKEQQKIEIQRFREEKASRAERAEHLVRIQGLKYLCAKGKMASFLAWCEDFLSSGEKLIICGIHTDLIEQVVEHLSTWGAVSITGQTPHAKRQEYVDRFQGSEFCRVIVCNLIAGGVGLTLTASSNVATFEFGWVAGLHTQMEDRSLRMGQKNAVTCWYFTANGTIEDYLISIVESKRATTDALIDGTTDKPQAGVIGDLTKWLLLKEEKKKKDDEKRKELLALYAQEGMEILFD